MTRNKENHFKIINESFPQENIAIPSGIGDPDPKLKGGIPNLQL